MAFIKGVGLHSHYFTASSQDTSNRLAASQFLYGSPMAVPIPDLLRTDLLVMMGANPVVSHGSFLTAPRIKDRMHDIVKRGGRVVVVDPRRRRKREPADVKRSRRCRGAGRNVLADGRARRSRAS